MKRIWHFLGAVVLVGALAGSARAADQLIPGKLFIAKSGGKLVKVLSKGIFTLPTGDPTMVGGSLHVFDEDPSPTGGDDTYALAAGGWSGLGSPPGTKGWKYKGAGTATDPCKIVLIKTNLIKAVCKDKGAGGVLLTPPFATALGVVLAVGADNYCAEFSYVFPCDETKNDATLVKIKDCGPPAACPAATCPLAPGIYTATQVAGGTLTVDSLSPFPFPSGGTIIQHVYSASPPACVHDTVVPIGGYTEPAYCIPGFNFSVRTTQIGCGVGKIDSNGGSDFTITETGDTSSPTICGLPASNCFTPPGDSNVQVNVKVGNGSADVCGAGTANMALSVPVFTTIWLHIPSAPCPDPDGMPGGPGDTTVAAFPHTIDFTTDTSSADWSDLDPDGCCLAGSGPSSPQACAFGGGGPSGLNDTGVCADLSGLPAAGTVTTTASGTLGSNGAPLYDITFSTTLPNTLSGPSGLPSATCASPPLINFGGTVTRCIP